MGMQSTGINPNKVGTRNITPFQVAFIVDKYLAENNYTQTLSVFRKEVKILSKAKGIGAPKSLMSLDKILDEYINMKGLEFSIDLEKSRIDRLLHGLGEVMNTYNSESRVRCGGSAHATQPTAHLVTEGTTSGNTFVANPGLMPFNSQTNSSPLLERPSSTKRKANVTHDVYPVTKRFSPQLSTSPKIGVSKEPLPPSKQIPIYQTSQQTSSTCSYQSPPALVRGNSPKSSSLQISPCPKTPSPLPFQVSDTISPLESLPRVSLASKNEDTSPVNRPSIILSEKPKTSSGCSKRDQVKGKLVFEDSNPRMDSDALLSAEISSMAFGDDGLQSFNIGVSDFSLLDMDVSLSGFLADIDIKPESSHNAAGTGVDNAATIEDPSEKDTNKSRRW